ncbi:uncharacterized protein EAF01_011569 [Botrytis porri]|uniref:Uncharacterized protein n=1 Tax=Botrytis porri TaxID=87229 RepID=A0A4Z1KDY9_9HELO|nr:uncharacterized protein EAF01_011569 [Botrytis porri]KAF7884146.1 hypothetical protein EAF01_011569 [Botrytis porri]TGO84277.1 hypothetical protein BPOR_0525g00090 [Botrytis porri]
MTSNNTSSSHPLQDAELPTGSAPSNNMMSQALSSGWVLRSDTKPNNKRALDLQVASAKQQKRRCNIPVLEGEAGEDGVVVGGILKVKAKHRDLAQAFLIRDDGTDLVIPHEVFLRVLDVLYKKDDIATLICLGLARKVFWCYKKRQHHRNYSKLSPLTKITLAPRLHEWMGLSYRIASKRTLSLAARNQCNVMYLSRQVYGKRGSDEETAMTGRYHTRINLQIPQPGVRGWPLYRTLVSPFGEGVEWYERALNDILQRAKLWRQGSGVRWDEALDHFWSSYFSDPFKEWVGDYTEEGEHTDGGQYELFAAKQKFEAWEEQFLEGYRLWEEEDD